MFRAVLGHWFVVNVGAALVRDGRYLMLGDTLPGGRVEYQGESGDVLEETLRREIGIQLDGCPEYVESKSFIADDGDRVLDVVFLCKYADGLPPLGAKWVPPEKILASKKTPWWVRRSVELAERKRIEKGW